MYYLIAMCLLKYPIFISFLRISGKKLKILFSPVFRAQFDLRHLFSGKVKPLSRAIQCCCGSFNVPLQYFVRLFRRF